MDQPTNDVSVSLKWGFIEIIFPISNNLVHNLKPLKILSNLILEEKTYYSISD